MDDRTKKLITDDQPVTKYESIKGRNSFRRKSNSYGMNISIDEDDQVSVGACCFWCTQRFFTVEKLKRRFPIIKWLPKYTTKDLKGDVIAGISVGFTILPQALAFAMLAGLPPQYGLYSSFMGCFIYAIFGGCRDAAIGPTSILSILTAPFALIGGPMYATLLAFISGIIMLICGFLNLGFIVDFVSLPVISAFSTSAAITILVSQLKSFFGLNYPSSRLIDNLANFIHHIHQVRLPDMCLGIACLLFLIPLQCFKDKRFLRHKSKQSSIRKLINSVWFVLVTGRNAVIVILTAILTYYFFFSQLTTPKEIEAGLPSIRLPKFTYVDFDSKENKTIEKSFDQVLADIGKGIPVVVLISILETVAVAKTFTGSLNLDATQEMVALGICNLVSSFFGSYPIAGSFSRSAVNHSSGVRTQLGGVLTGIIVLLAIQVLTPVFSYIPQSTLSAIIVVAVLPMIKFGDVIIIFNSNCIDLIPYMVTLITSLTFGLEFGVMSGVAVSLIMLLYSIARPRISIVIRTVPNSAARFVYVKPDRSVFFPSVEYMKVKINKACPTKKKNTIDGVMFQDSRDLGDISDRSMDGRKTVSVSYSSSTIPQSLSDSKLNNAMENSKTNIIDAQMTNGKMNGSANDKGYNKQQRSNTIIGPTIITPNNQGELVAVVIDGEHMFRCDSTYAVAIKNLVLNLKKKNLMTIFFNLRKPTHRALLSTLGEEEFYYCVLESQVYELIKKFANESDSRDRSSSTSSETDHSDEMDYIRPEKHWISQSTEAF